MAQMRMEGFIDHVEVAAQLGRRRPSNNVRSGSVIVTGISPNPWVVVPK
jgi:hypothetical protein